jgi:signal transduction histidine kinase
MRIRLKTLLICGLVALLAISMIYVISRNTLMEQATSSESEYVQAEINRVQIVLSNEFFRLNTAVSDWANWDDTYQFMEDNNINYMQSNLVPQALHDLNLNLMLFVNLNGTVMLEKAYSLDNMTEINFDPSQITSKYPVLLQSETEPSHGIIQLREGPMLVASAPVLTSDYQGPPHGMIIFGRFLDNAELASLSNIVGLPICLQQINDSTIEPALLEANKTLSIENNLLAKPLNQSYIAGYSFIRDINQAPVALLQVTIPRTEYAQAQVSVFYLAVSIGLVGLILILLILLLLDRFVLSRLSKLSKNVEHLSLENGQLVQFEFRGKDEISSLAGRINEMVRVINEAQINLKDYATNLESKVEDKTKELLETQKKLVQAERLSVIGQMAAVVGHDLRNPLHGIRTAVYCLRKNAGDQLDENGKKILGLVDKDLESADKILNDLLDYSREVRLEKENIKLEVLVADSVSSVRVPEKVHVINSVDKSLEINVDPAKMKRVFFNLVGNAIDAMPDGGSLTIQAASAGKSVEVSFSDKGIGIAPENIDKLWKPLFTTKTKGIGLGLVICKRFVEAHGGTITVTSEKGQGTNFTVILPAFHGNN